MSQEMATTPTTPMMTKKALCTARFIWPMTSAAAVAMIGVISGAIIMAPITVAVESLITPTVAMMVARTRRTPKRSR